MRTYGRKAVIKLDKHGRVVGRYESATAAAMSNNFTVSAISRRCNKEAPDDDGYRYRYAGGAYHGKPRDVRR